MMLQERFKSLREDLKVSMRPAKRKDKTLPRPNPETEAEPTPALDNDYQLPNCTLFRLPREIRDRIWEYAIGDNVLHIGNPSARKITHVLCRADMCDVQALALYPFTTSKQTLQTSLPKTLPPGQASTAPDLRDPHLRHHAYRHSACFSNSWRLARIEHLPNDPDVAQTKRTIRDEQLSLAALRTCRAVHAEMARVLWARNSFAFGKSTTFSSFVSGRTAVQWEWLRHLMLRTEQPVWILAENELAKLKFKDAQRSFWGRALRLLPNLSSVFLAARFDLSWQVARSIWCDGELATPPPSQQQQQHGGREIELIDDLAAKPLLASVFLHVESIEVGYLYFEESTRLWGCDELQEDLHRLLLMRIAEGRRRVGGRFEQELGSSPSGASAKLELSEEERERRMRSWEEYVEAKRDAV